MRHLPVRDLTFALQRGSPYASVFPSGMPRVRVITHLHNIPAFRHRFAVRY